MRQDTPPRLDLSVEKPNTLNEETKKRVLALSEEQRRILAQRLTRSKPVGRSSQIPRQNRKTNIFPASFAQQRLWFLHEVSRNSSAFNLVTACRLEGPLNHTALQSSLNDLVKRHEVLRTTFRAEPEGLMQVIGSAFHVAMPFLDLKPVSSVEHERELYELVQKECHHDFDLTKGPLFRTCLVGLAPNDHVLLLNRHHIVSDLWSMGVLFRELDMLYTAFVGGGMVSLESLPIQYADFSVWQREQLNGETLNRHVHYWKERLANLPILQLPTDHPRPAIQTYNGSRETVVMPRQSRDALAALSHQHGVTMFMTMLAGFAVLLHRYTDQHDIVLGSPIGNRNRPELEGLIGFFVNMVIMRIDICGDLSFRNLLARVRDVALGAYEHQDLPFEKIVEETKTDRDPSRSPVFQVTFGFLNAPMSMGKVGDLKLSFMPTHIETTRFDLEVDTWDGQDSLSIRAVYNTDLFKSDSIQKMLGHFRRVLEGVVVDPDRRISELELLAPDEREEIVYRWNKTGTTYPKEATIVELFEQQVASRSDTVATVFEDQQLTYGELNAWANRLANYLIKLGVKPEIRVGLCMERSVDLIVGLLGILKAGGAYVPMDLEYPKHRLALMLDDSAASVVITQSHLSKKLPDHSAKRVYLDADREAITKESDQNPASRATGENLAYVMYTSGSTGTPKGVAIPHRAINRLVSNTNYIQIEPGDRVVQASNTSFDAATFEIWGALLNGAKLVGIDRHALFDPRALADFLEKQRITIMFITTALFNQMARQQPGAFRGLRVLLFGGETVDPSCVRAVLQARGPQRLLHMYGPTETTTFATWYPVEDVPDNAVTIPIGYPIANTQTYVLDGGFQPVPVGVYGELYIGGDGLAREYLNQFDLTKERFVANPFSDDVDARLYKTGDIVRYLADGSIAFMGRSDHQVKVRGFRVELGEIEATLKEHPFVKEAIVLCREDVPGDKRLVAYLVKKPGTGISMGELGTFVRSRLATYMVPSAFIMLDGLPITPNGKIDRSALPAPVETRRSNRVYVSPGTEGQRILAGVWKDILKIDEVGIHDNFFDLGGHSLLMMQAVARFEKETGFRLNPVDFFHQTLGQIAASYDDHEPDSTPHELDTRISHEIIPHFFGSEQRRLFGIYRVPRNPRNQGVVLCYPHGHEYIRCHRTLRDLARSLAMEGYHVLTFDYHGSGDSEGIYENERITDWCRDISTAVDAIKDRFSLQRVCLVGLRLGASLAVTTAAKRDDIDALVLWDPVINGKAFVEEMMKLPGPIAGEKPPFRCGNGGYDVFGYPLTLEIIQDLEQLDLLSIGPLSVDRVYVIETGQQGGGSKMNGFVKNLGANVAFQYIREARVWLYEPYEGMVPKQTLESAIQWISGG